MSPTHVRIATPILAVVLLIFAWRLWSREPSLTPDQLADIALNGATVDERTKAAVVLADYGEAALPSLRSVVKESDVEAVQSVCLQGLAKQWDYESMDLFLDLAETGPPRVRGRAAQVFMRMTGRQRPFQASAPEPHRSLLVSHMRADWKQIQAATPAEQEDLKRRLRESHEKKSGS